MKSKSLLAVSILASLLAAHEVSALVTAAAVPKAEKAPAIDGVASPGEWDKAMLADGFTLTQAWPANLSQREVRMMAQWDEGNLYICVQSRIYPAGRRLDNFTRQGVRGGNILADDTIEMGLWPADIEPGKIADGYHYFYGLYNSAGTRDGSRHLSFFESSPWPGIWDIKMANGISPEWWTAEFAVPAKAIGLEKFENGRTYAFSVTRTFQKPMFWTSWSSTHAPVWTKFTDTLPAARIHGVTSLMTGKSKLAVDLVGGREALDADYRITVQRKEEALAEKVIDVSGKITVAKGAVVKIPVPETEFELDPKVNQYSIRITTGKGDDTQVIYDAGHSFLAWDKKQEELYNVKVFDSGMGFRYSPYITTKTFWGRADILGTQYEKDVAAAEMSVSFGGKEIGKGRSEKNVSGYIEVRVPVDEMPAGKYRLAMSVLDKNGKELERKEKEWFREPLPWEGNKIGMDDILVPPYTAVQVKDQTVSCILRDYQLGPLGLPAQITALDEKILSAPISFYTGTDPGGSHDLKFDAPAKFAKTKDTAAEFESEGTAGPLTFKAKGVYEFDGYSWYDIEISPKDAKSAETSGLGLKIPFNAKFAKLYNAYGRGAAKNLCGGIPPGQGRVWDSLMVEPQRTMGDIAMPLPFYMWIGDPDRGLAFYFESDQAWKRLARIPTHQIVRDPATGDIQLLVQMIQYPVTIDKPFTLSFGFMATPVRPILGFHPKSVTDKFPKGSLKFARSNTLCPPIPTWGRSYSFIPDIRMPWDKLNEALNKYLDGAQVPENERIGVLGPYSDRQSAPWLEPGIMGGTYRGEWSRFSLGRPDDNWPLYIDGMPAGLDASKPESAAEFGYLGCAVSQSYNDMRVYYHDLALKNCPSYGGCYFDNLVTGDIGEDPELPGHGYFLPDGRWQGCWMARLQRQLLKRYAVAATVNKKPVITSDNGVAMPLFSAFLNWGLFGEGMSKDTGDYLLEPGIEAMQIMCSKQWGSDNFCLVQMQDKRAKKEKEYGYRGGVDMLRWRNAYGTLMIHGTANAHGIWYEQARSDDMALAPFRGKDDVEFIPYWRNAPCLVRQDPGALVSFYVRQQDSKETKRLLIAALNTAKEPPMREVAFQISFKALGIDPVKIKNVYDPQRAIQTLNKHYPVIYEPVHMDKGTGEISFDCRAHDYKTIVVEY